MGRGGKGISYRSAVQDSLGRTIDLSEEIRIWLDDDLEDRRAPEGWVHLRTAREASFFLLSGQVVEISLDNDLNGDQEFGRGYQVVDFLEEMSAVYGRDLWPKDGISLHTANSGGRERMMSALRTLESRIPVRVEEVAGPRPKFIVHSI